MRIVIDLQACQSTGSRTRGIGRYSMALAQAMARQAGQHEIWLLLSGLFPDTIAPIRAAFDGLVPPERIRVWDAPGPVSAMNPANTWRRRAAELVREQALAELEPDIVHVSSLFEGQVDDAVTSVGALPEHIPTAVTLYDLIPLVYASHYLADPNGRDWYHRKLQYLRNADLLLSISEATRDEGLAWLRVEDERIVNISSAVDDRFQPIRYADDELARVRAQYGLTRRFVMYTGGIDHRKNIEGLIRAFAKLPLDLRRQYQLAVVCSVQPNERKRLEDLAQSAGLARDELVMTGFVPDEVLPMLYNDCALFVFPSWHEGFGLPALEAMSCGAPVIAANNSSLPEVVGRADALFNPRDEQAIAARMALALTDRAFADSLRAHGLEQAKKFSWDASALRAIAAFEAFHARRMAEKAARPLHRQPQRKPRLAFVSPLPPERSGISDYSAILLEDMARFYEIELILAQPTVEGSAMTANFPLRDWRWFEAHADRYDRVFYHFGNSEFHTHMFGMLERHPGVVVLHDFFMSGVLAWREGRDLPDGWTNALYHAHGYAALAFRAQNPDVVATIMRYPCNLDILENADGIIVHADFSRSLARRWYGEAAARAMRFAPLHRPIPAAPDQAASRARLGLKDDDFIVTTFGLLAPTKLNQELLDAFLVSPLAQDPRAHLVFVGQNDGGDYGAKLLKTLNASPAASRIRITGYTSTPEFHDWAAATDVAVQLRAMSRGETSGAVLDIMSYGKPTIVNAHAAMDELPADVVIKLADGFRVEELADALTRLHQDADLRDRFGAAAHRRVAYDHSPRVVAGLYADAIETFANEYPRARRRRTIAAIADIEAPVAPSDADVAGVAEALAGTFTRCGLRQVLVDVTGWRADDARCAGLRALLVSPPAGWRIEPVAMQDGALRYARAFTCALLGLRALADEAAEAGNGDIYIGKAVPPAWQARGVAVHAAMDDCPLLASLA